MVKKINVKVNDKVIIVSVDWDFFGRLLIVVNIWEINLKEVLSYELLVVLFVFVY